jgi:tetratricopeptide (TPR) repeat protein
MEDRTNEAITRMREANKLSRDLHDLRGLALGLNNLGLALERAGELEQAKHAFRQSLEIATRAHDESAMARAWSSLGTAAFNQRAYEEAQEAYQRAVSLATQSDDKGLRAEMLLNSASACEL